MDPAHVLVLDIGKTNAKAALVDAATLAELDVLTTPNAVLPGPPYPHVDTDRLWSFLLDAIRTLHRQHRVDALTVVTHGATAALLDADGGLALPILDYEHDGPDELAAAYDAARPDFAETGSPRLPHGLNLGAQLHWLIRRFPEAARTAAIVPYPQYWSYRLSGVAASEPTSLGAHTDLWAPHARDFSSLVDTQDWRRRMAPLRRAADRLGPVTPAVARQTGLDPATPVFCGLHDSNASLVPHLLSHEPPFAVISTGTWVICMAVGGQPAALDPARDTLINVNAFGDPVPSARFMGGREHARLMGGRTAPRDAGADADTVLARGIMHLPAVEQGSGPYQGRRPRWSGADESTLSDGERAAAVAYYLALVTGTCLEIIAAAGPGFVEGPFAGNPHFLEMLAAVTDRPVLTAPGSATGTAAGAALLTRSAPRPPAGPATPVDIAASRRAALTAHADAWHDRVRRTD